MMQPMSIVLSSASSGPSSSSVDQLPPSPLATSSRSSGSDESDASNSALRGGGRVARRRGGPPGHGHASQEKKWQWFVRGGIVLILCALLYIIVVFRAATTTNTTTTTNDNGSGDGTPSTTSLQPPHDGDNDGAAAAVVTPPLPPPLPPARTADVAQLANTVKSLEATVAQLRRELRGAQRSSGSSAGDGGVGDALRRRTQPQQPPQQPRGVVVVDAKTAPAAAVAEPKTTPTVAAAAPAAPAGATPAAPATTDELMNVLSYSSTGAVATQSAAAAAAGAAWSAPPEPPASSPYLYERYPRGATELAACRTQLATVRAGGKPVGADAATATALGPVTEQEMLNAKCHFTETFVGYFSRSATGHAYLNLVDVLLTSYHTFTERPILMFAFDSDVPPAWATKFPNLLVVTMKANARHPFYDKLPALARAAEWADYLVYIDCDAVVNYRVTDMFRIARASVAQDHNDPASVAAADINNPNPLARFPFLTRHFNQHDTVGNWDGYGLKNGAQPYSHAAIVIFTRHAIPFFRRTYALAMEGKVNTGCCADEMLMNYVYWTENSPRQLMLCEPPHKLIPWWNFYLNQLNDTALLSRMNTPFLGFMVFHGNKHVDTARDVLEKLKAKSLERPRPHVYYEIEHGRGWVNDVSDIHHGIIDYPQPYERSVATKLLTFHAQGRPFFTGD